MTARNRRTEARAAARDLAPVVDLDRDGAHLALLGIDPTASEPDHLVLLGDTGCR
ncbi:hypothetical protein TEK04_08775 [Klenkia sp. LSe6-5]|uniref:Uncharacterized protein n=1 Tax=Klenkia sesuvii TaxID=3103137 RepID=A0ABU8DSY0_9ACTN